MTTNERPETIELRGGPYDGHTVPLRGFQIEVPALCGPFVNWVYSIEQEDDVDLGVRYFGAWGGVANEGWDGVTLVAI